MSLDLSDLDAALTISATSVNAPQKAEPARFVEDPNNPRFEADDPELAALAEDIREHGILQPIVVTTQEDSDRLHIRFGHRRFRAARIAGLAELPYLVIEDARQLDDYAQISENEQRRNLTPLELATFISRKIEAGQKRKDIAAKLKIDASAVTHLLSLIEAPEFIRELYHSRRCRQPLYLYQLRKWHEQHADVVMSMCADVEKIDKALIEAIADAIAHATADRDDPKPLKGRAPLENFKRARAVSDDSHGRDTEANDGESGASDVGVAMPEVSSSATRSYALLAKWQEQVVCISLTELPAQRGCVYVTPERAGEVVVAPLSELQLIDVRTVVS